VKLVLVSSEAGAGVQRCWCPAVLVVLVSSGAGGAGVQRCWCPTRSIAAEILKNHDVQLGNNHRFFYEKENFFEPYKVLPISVPTSN